jgi:hypothetical protein
MVAYGSTKAEDATFSTAQRVRQVSRIALALAPLVKTQQKGMNMT